MVIASCTSYPKRIGNLPKVIETVLKNTCPPDKVIINLSRDEFPNEVIPEEVQHFVDANKKVSINWLDDNWGVYKKFLPILPMYPDDLIFPFDDDILYPNDIIEEALKTHKKYPKVPVSCNHYWYGGLNAHCGAGSLVQAKHFEGWEKFVTPDMIRKCPASDLFYTQFVAMNGYFYKNTDKHYPAYWKLYNEGRGYSASIPNIRVNTQRELYNVLGQHVKMIFNHNEFTPVCVLNIFATPRGLAIEEEFLKWLPEHYNVIIVEHDGTKFEYPGLKLAHNYVVNNDIKVPIVYMHSKGAWHVRRESVPCRRMWKHEFTVRKNEYLKAVEGESPIIATPYQGELHRYWNGIVINEGEVYNIPYENGWMANAAAVKQMNVFISENRYDYEVVIYKGIDMIGMRMQHIAGEDIPSRKKITEEIMTFIRT